MKALRRLTAVVCCLLFSAFTFSDLPSQIATQNDYYTLDKIEPASEPGMLQFHITSSHAIYTVQGFRSLIKMLREIEVIERIKRDNQGSGFFDGASASVDATAKGLENLVSHPIQSVQGLGKATGKIGKGIGGMFRKKDKAEKSSFGEKMLGSNERELAKEFGVDVYTTNPYLKGILTQMARSRMGGKGAVLALKILVPVAFVASVAITAGGINGAADQLVDDSSRGDLFRMNKQSLLQMGWDEGSIEKFLNLSYFSPREQTYFRFYLEKLQKVENIKTLGEAMLKAPSELAARRQLYEMEMAAALAEKNSFTKLWDSPEGLALWDGQGKLFYISAYDDLSGSDLEHKALEQIQQIKNETKASSVEFWNGGHVSDSLTSRLRSESIKSRAWACFEDADENL